MQTRKLINLVSQASEGKDNLKEGAVGFNNYGFVFRSFNEMIPPFNLKWNSGLCSIGALRNFAKNYFESDNVRDIRELLDYDEVYDLYFIGTIKTLVPTMGFGIEDELFFHVWMLVKTPEGKYFPTILYRGVSGLTVSAWSIERIISEEKISHKEYFPEDFQEYINCDPFNFKQDEIDDFIEALECSLDKVPVSDFEGVYKHDLGKNLMGIRNGEPIVERVNYENETWSYTILGNTDARFKIRDQFRDILYDSFSQEEHKEHAYYYRKLDRRPIRLMRTAINRCYYKLVELARNLSSRLAYQVLGVLILEHGGNMTDDLRRRILDNSKWEFERRQLKNRRDRNERKKYLFDFREKVMTYKVGEVVEIPYHLDIERPRELRVSINHQI